MSICKNFQERVFYICALQTGGKLSSEQAYEQVKCLTEAVKAE